MRRSVVAAICLVMAPMPAFAADEDPEPAAGGEVGGRIYTTPREKRAAGLGSKLTDWLTFYGLVEVELASVEDRYRGNAKDAGADRTGTTVQLGFKAEFDEQSAAEIVLEFDSDNPDSSLDEAFIELKKDDAGLSIGQMMVPFGAYYSHFITDPLLQFGETKGTTLLAAYEHDEVVEVFAFGYDGNARETGDEDRIRDWGAAVEARLIKGRVQLGASYLSDLADSDAELLSDFDNLYQDQVSAWSAFAVARPGDWEISGEMLQATVPFRELGANTDEPRAWNLEVAWFPVETWQIALRHERSAELVGEVKRRLGIGASWFAFKNVNISVEYLRGEYQRDFAFDDADNELKRQNIVAAQVALEF